MNTPSKHTRGFTLIELLVVISIIGLLSSIALASVSTARINAQRAAFKTEAKQLLIAYDNWKTNHPSATNFGTGTYIGYGCVDGVENTIFNSPEFKPILESMNKRYSVIPRSMLYCDQPNIPASNLYQPSWIILYSADLTEFPSKPYYCIDSEGNFAREFLTYRTDSDGISNKVIRCNVH